MIVLSYDGGDVVAKGGPILHGKYDPVTRTYRAPGFRYAEILRHLEDLKIPYEDEVFGGIRPRELSSGIELRDYQEGALKAWESESRRGVVVLPTGAGKTVVAIKAIERVGEAALVVVPTLVLVDQWRRRLEEELGIRVGVVGGGSGEVRTITVATYDSASIKASRAGNLFRLLVFDEVHHLPAESYRRIATMYTAPYRMGLTATLSKNDGSRAVLRELVGDVVYEMGVNELAGIHLSDYSIQTVHVPLSPEERGEYDRGYAAYRGFLQRRGIRLRSARDYQRFVMRTGRDPEARRALLSRNRAMDVALNSSAKIEYLKRLIRENPDEKALVFTTHNKLVYRISREMLIPAITHQTPGEERSEILERFKSGRYRRIVTSRVLDEGVDVPDASLAVIISGSGSNRQFVQRLGRVLRKSEGKQARLVELVSQGTAETRLSARRKRS
ncbi:MAG: DEAD/DEAH box helicase family protein [Candidatus Bathyarchaeota archaeon]|nr:MAG: DEAD/DEAH box helicase family protein [Candidatus Bathyarchaeota archaeon]